MENKYQMTQEQNIFLAKRNIVDSIWKSANLEGIDVTFPETQQIYDGGNVERLRLDELITINNLKHAWYFILTSLDTKVDFKYISSVNSLVGSNLIDSPGKMRAYDVKIAGTEWKPELATKEKIQSILENIKQIENDTDRAIIIMAKLMKLQIFSDGNKRTAMLIANHELIKNGRGILSVSEKNKVEFGVKLIKYYENEDNLEELKQFIYNNCIDGINIEIK